MNSTHLENQNFIAVINNFGAEPARFFDKRNSREILWDAQPEFWGRHAPVLFPTVGKLKEGYYIFEGKRYALGQHGFARDMEWEVIDHQSDSCIYLLCSNVETKKKYPFDFQLELEAKLCNDGISLSYAVTNTGEQKMYYSLGTHPAFHLPWKKNTTIQDYELRFQEKEQAEILLLTTDGLRSGDRKLFLDNKNKIPLSEDLFKNDALVFDNLRSSELSVIESRTGEGFKAKWENFPHLGIWKPIGAPFICIEPWQGMADDIKSVHQLTEKFGILSLEKNERKEHSYQVSPIVI